ncbi:MAG TPA: 3-isopropylmalate dehydratase large subunit [Longimicrobiales bacterium]|nr:3-isopropylmalate dehydratase large subunit [Longimicrobiales bacterium]
MKRRDFIRTSLGAGFAVSLPHRDLFAPFQAQVGRGTLFEKIWNSHVVANLGGDTDLLQVDRHHMADNGAGLVHRMLEEGLTIVDPEIHWAVPDHSASTSPDRYTDPSLHNSDAWREFVDYADELRELGIHAFGMDDPRHGIQHVVGPETGLSQPGMVLVAGDSHTCTHGALGLISWGGERSENVLLTGTVIRRRPRTMRVTVQGTMGPWLRGKDVILRTIGLLGADSGNGYAVEYAGPVVRALPQEARFSICAMAVEMASPTGMVGPDDTTYEWMAGREFAPRGRFWDQALAHWRTLPTDDDAVFDREETIDMSGVDPQVTWGVSPEHVIGINDRIPSPENAPPEKREAYRIALDYTGLRPGDPIMGTPIDEVFIGSCVESRITDLRVAADVVRGRRVAENVIAWVVPGSRQVKSQAEAEGLDRVFREAGFQWREPSCSKCYGSNGDHVPPGRRSLSNSNRNFIGRQGTGAITHLVSTPMAAAGAITGRITDVRRLVAGEPA